MYITSIQNYKNIPFKFSTLNRSLFLSIFITLFTTACLGGGGGGGSSSSSNVTSSMDTTPGSDSSGSSGSGTPSAQGSVELSWEAPTTDTKGNSLLDLAGYTIYFGTNQNSLNQIININNAGLTTYTINNLSLATYYFAISAKDTSNNESSRSNIASIVIR